MLSYSPYDNVTPQRHPAMLVLTGLWDSQVQYYEPAKWVAFSAQRKCNDARATEPHPATKRKRAGRSISR